MIDALTDAVETLSILLKRSRELREKGGLQPGQLESVEQLIDETFASIHLLLRVCRETSPAPRQETPKQVTATNPGG